MHVNVRYTHKLRPDANARLALVREADLARYVWNALVDEAKRVRRVIAAILREHHGVPRDELPLVPPAGLHVAPTLTDIHR